MRGVEPGGVLAAGDLGREHSGAAPSPLEALERPEGRNAQRHVAAGTRAVLHSRSSVSFFHDVDL